MLCRRAKALTKIKTRLKGISLEVVTKGKRKVTLVLIILSSLRVFFSPPRPESAAVCTSLSETDRYTQTHAKIRSAVGAGVGGALFDHLIL